jgi:hypothetical protein
MKPRHRSLSIAVIFVFSLLTFAQSGPGQGAAPEKEPLHTFTEAEAKAFLASLDEIVEFAEADTGLAMRKPIQKEMASREQVETYLLERMAEDPDTKRLEHSEVVVKKLGLLPAEFDLKGFLVKLYREQVAGFYDAKRKTAFLLDWIAPEVQRPVMAHELTHALQDQAVGLEEWIEDARARARQGGESGYDVEFDESSSARAAVIEGQGVVVMLDYVMRPSGRTVAEAPWVVALFQKSTETVEPGSLAATAPLLIRESSLFPYREGLNFLSEVLQAGGKERAFAGVLKDPPATTRQVLMPETYLQGEKPAAPAVPDLAPALGREWERYDTGSIGQFDVVLLAKQYEDEAVEKEVSKQWRSGYYVAAQRKGSPVAKTGDIALLMVTRWASAEAAARFAEFYRRSIGKRYAGATKTEAGWMTPEGAATVEARGDAVISLESFPEALAAKVRATAVESLKQARPAARASAPELSLRLAAPIWAVQARSGMAARALAQMDLTGICKRSSTSPTSFCTNGSAKRTPANNP